jgi:hypothetical protein
MKDVCRKARGCSRRGYRASNEAFRPNRSFLPLSAKLLLRWRRRWAHQISGGLLDGCSRSLGYGRHLFFAKDGRRVRCACGISHLRAGADLGAAHPPSDVSWRPAVSGPPCVPTVHRRLFPAIPSPSATRFTCVPIFARMRHGTSTSFLVAFARVGLYRFAEVDAFACHSARA